MMCRKCVAPCLIAMMGMVLDWAGQAHAADETSLRVTLESNRSTYVVTEDPIILQLAVTNVSSERVQVVDLRQIGPETVFASQVIMLALADAGGRSDRLSDYCGGVDDYFPGDKTRWLAPGEVMQFSFGLNQPCPQGMSRSRVSGFLDRPGRYTITATYLGLVADNLFTPDPTDTRFLSVTSQALAIVVERGLSVEPGDAACAADDECITFQNTCSACGCGVPINKQAAKKYAEQIIAICGQIFGGPCGSVCPTPFARCVAGRCALSER